MSKKIDLATAYMAIVPRQNGKTSSAAMRKQFRAFKLASSGLLEELHWIEYEMIPFSPELYQHDADRIRETIRDEFLMKNSEINTALLEFHNLLEEGARK